MFTTFAFRDVAAMDVLSPTRLAYLAGIIDGEGCISIRKTRRTGSMRSTRYAASITVGNTSRELIERLVSAFGAGCVTYRYPTNTKRACYLWSVQSDIAREVLRLVGPYLIVKREQAAVLIEFVAEFDSFKGARPGKKGGPLVSVAELARRERLYQQMRTLNRVGPRAGDAAAPEGHRSVGVTAQFAATRTLLSN